MGGYAQWYSLNLRINKEMRDRIDRLAILGYTQPQMLEAGVNALEVKEEEKQIKEKGGDSI